MNKVLLFGGTGEGRALAEWMVARDIPHTVCVATEYGETLLPAGAEAHVGRMDSGEMEALMRAGGYSLAVDATHPYAVEVTEHIRAAAEAAGLPVLRLVVEIDDTFIVRLSTVPPADFHVPVFTGPVGVGQLPGCGRIPPDVPGELPVIGIV